MTARLPGTCEACGARVELELGPMHPPLETSRLGYSGWRGPTYWAEPDSVKQHECPS